MRIQEEVGLFEFRIYRSLTRYSWWFLIQRLIDERQVLGNEHNHKFRFPMNILDIAPEYPSSQNDLSIYNARIPACYRNARM